MPKKIATLFLMFVATQAAHAQKIKAPADVNVPIGRLASISHSIDADEVNYEVLGGDFFDSFREFSSATELRLRVLGYASGTGYVVISSVKGGKLQPLHIVRVTIGTPPAPVPPPPGPGPGPEPIPPSPVPPGPIDPLVAAIRDAVKADGMTKLKLADMVIGLNAAHAISTSRANWTVADLSLAWQGAIRSAMGGPTPPALRKLLGEQLNAVLPRDAEHAMTAEEMLKARELILALAKACEAAK